MMRKLLALGAVLTCAATVQAGSSLTPEVEIEGSGAYGNLHAVRQSEDNIQYIGCTVYAGKFGSSATCYARNALGATLTCSTTDEEMIRMANSVKAESTLYFERGADGGCESISIHHNSDSVPGLASSVEAEHCNGGADPDPRESFWIPNVPCLKDGR